MSEQNAKPGARLETWLARVLIVGVLAAAAVALLGAGLYLARHSADRVALTEFHPAVLRSPTDILRGAAALDPLAVIQLSVLILIATPVLRVVAALLVFAAQRDRLYTVISLIVLAGLALGLAGVIE